jgi:hypothetical protein
MAKIEDNVIARMKEMAPLNFDLAKKIALEFDLKERSIVACAIRNKIEYVNKPRVGKSGAPVVSKSDLVATIAENLAIDAADLNGLEKATKNALVAIATASEVPEEAEETEET